MINEKVQNILDSSSSNFVELVNIAGLDPARNFRFSNLAEVDFSYCDLSGFNFSGAILKGAIFFKAKIKQAIFDSEQIHLSELRSATDYWDMRSEYVANQNNNHNADSVKSPSISELISNTLKQSKSVQLNALNLQEIPSSILRPNYEKSELSPGIVHIGVGNFHRAHQAWYLHRLMQMGWARNWGIVGASVRNQEEKFRERFLEQDCLTTLVELNPNEISFEIVGSIIDFLPIEDGHSPLIEMMANPQIRIVSLTITEGGYFIDRETGEFDSSHLDILYDLSSPDKPRTVFGAIIAALKLRYTNGLKPFTVLSCDNLPNNGAVVRNIIVSHAKLSDPQFASWIESEGAFPSTSVDCIVPRTSSEVVSLVEEIGINDAAPVQHENYRKWVIEDQFSDGRPDLERVGVEFVGSVKNHNELKAKVLNAGHQIIGNVAELLSIEWVHECMADKDIVQFFEKVLTQEIAPISPLVADLKIQEYIQATDKRFANFIISDTVQRIVMDGYLRHSRFVHPAILEVLGTGNSTEGLSLAEAFWAQMCTGVREDGSKIRITDSAEEVINAAAQASLENPKAWLENLEIYDDLIKHDVFVENFVKWLGIIRESGCREAIRIYCS